MKDYKKIREEMHERFSKTFEKLHMSEKNDEITALRAEVAYWKGYAETRVELARRTNEHAVKVQAENERLKAALENIKWQSADKDNMEFEARITCFQMDAIHDVLNKEPAHD
jgi:hypothetical protein